MPEPSRPAAPRLSICIATMNRATVIGGTLERIADQIDGAGEVVILDGSRDDATERVIGGFRDRLPGLRYERHPPQGLDRDYARVIDLARGDYCWPFTDDDILLPGADAAVQRRLTREPDCVVVNFQYWNPAMDRLLLANCLGIEENREYSAGQYADLARDTLVATSFIASLVVRRTLWPKLVWSLPGMSDAAREKATAREPWRNVKRLVRLRATTWLPSRRPMELVHRCARFHVRRFRSHLELFRAELEGAIKLRRQRRPCAA